MFTLKIWVDFSKETSLGQNHEKDKATSINFFFTIIYVYKWQSAGGLWC